MGKQEIRITVVGDGDTGKTCMLVVYKDKKFEEEYVPTIFDQYSMTIPINNKNYTVILQDTAGQEEFELVRTLAYKDTDVFILCYAVNDSDSLTNVKEKWAPELKTYCPKAGLILVGTKSDLKAERKISIEEGKLVANLIDADDFIENSAKEMRNIDETICLALLAHVNLGNKRKKNCIIQ